MSENIIVGWSKADLRDRAGRRIVTVTMDDRVGGTTKRTLSIDVGSEVRTFSNCPTVSGVQWRYDPDRCGEAGLSRGPSPTEWRTGRKHG